jgi:Na+-transporting NADH:ubiquinone oxidoreductase subunit NqrB
MVDWDPVSIWKTFYQANSDGWGTVHGLIWLIFAGLIVVAIFAWVASKVWPKIAGVVGSPGKFVVGAVIVGVLNVATDPVVTLVLSIAMWVVNSLGGLLSMLGGG